jgi:hypothetical protein
MTAALATAPTPYLDAVPASEPPYDDDIAAVPGSARQTAAPARTAPAAVTGSPNLQPTVPTVPIRALVRPTATGWSTTGRRTAIGATDVPPWSSESDIGVRRTGTGALPPAARSGQVFARALVEILSGRRPLAQLRVHCAPDIYAGLLNRSLPAAVCLPHLLTVRVCEPADGVAEVSAAFKRAQRVRAIAFRLQGVDGRWRITALEVG